jgi:predicted ATPase
MINRISIKNFKSIQDLNLQLLPLNILIGANGAGKSNFISFFKCLNSLYFQQLQRYVAEQAGADNILHFGLKNSHNLVGNIEFDNKNIYYFTLKSNNEGNLYFEKEGTRFKAYGVFWDDVPIADSNKESKLIELKQGRYHYVNSYMQSFKIFHFHDTSDTAKIKQKSNIDDNSFLRENGQNLAAYLYFLQEKHPKDFKKIEKTIQSIAPFFDRFVLQPDRIREDQIRLEWQEKNSDMYLNAAHLSDGTLRFMVLATLLLQPNLPKVIIIDEPELGLHPFAINKLAGLIKKASAQSQIIIATQSVNLIDNFEPEDIITVDRKEGQSVFQRQSSETLKNWLTEYSIGDLWNKNVIGGRP